MAVAPNENDGRRRGGREARRTLRAAPVPRNEAPVKGGMEGGRYLPLDDHAIRRIHETALEVLEEVGMGNPIPSCVEVCTAIGAVMGDDGRLRFPRALVEDVVAKAARHFTLYGQTPEHDMQPMGSKVYYGTAGAAVNVVDLETRRYRDSLLQDLYDAARIVDTCDNIHFFQRCMVPRDMLDPRDLDINTLYASVMGTRKHVGTSFVQAEHAEEGLQILYAIAGGEEKFRARPFVSNSNCFVVPPLKFAEDACRVLEVLVRGGMPILLLSAGQAGATAPAAIAGAVVQAVAEVLAGLVYVNAIRPGHPAIFGTWPFVSDLRTGAMAGGSAEQALLTAACAQMARFYDLPGGSAAGMADAKLPDVQSGYEKGITDVMAGLAGLNLVYEAAGMHASLLGFCLESLIIDNDMLGQCMRCVRGIEVTEDSLSKEAIKRVCLGGAGHYLGDEQTLALMQTEYVYPRLGDRNSPNVWVEQGASTMAERAIVEKERILSSHFPDHVPDGIDRALRSRHKICLPRTAIGRDE